MYRHFCLPDDGFEFGLRSLGNYDDVINLSKYVTQNKVIKVYMEHGQPNFLTYFMSSKGHKRIITEDIENEEPPNPPSPVVAQQVVT